MLDKNKALKKAQLYCAKSEHCTFEVTQKLEKWGADSTSIDEIVLQLKKERFIDDERFCKAFVNDKYRFSKWGKKKIAQHLYFKQLPNSIIDAALNSIPQEAYAQLLLELLQTKRLTVKAKDDYELKNKLVRFAMGRGFEWSDIEDALAKIL